MPRTEKDFEIERLSSTEWIEEIVRLHRQLFSPFLIGELGRPFTRFFYKKILNDKNGVIYICKKRGQLRGFVAGLITTEGFYDLKFYLIALTGLMVNFLCHPIVIRNLLLHALRQKRFDQKIASAELLGIAITPQYQGEGMGGELLHAFENFLKSKGVQKYKVMTEMKFNFGYKFYEKYGFSLGQEVDVLGIKTRMYFKAVDGK